MLNPQTTQTNPPEFSRGNDRIQLMANLHHRNRITEKMDVVISEKIDEALWQDEVLRSTDYKELEVCVADQIVYMSGHVMSTMNQQRVENAVRTVSGILGVKSALFSDDQLTREVAGALGQIEHVYKVKFFTGVRHGVVSLNGEVGSINVRSLAEKCAASVSGVRGVINHIRTSGITQEAEDTRFLQPTIGEQIYFRDGPSGIVIQVIMNPNNRLVVAMVVQGRFPKSQPRFQSRPDGETSPSEKFVIPTSEIRYLTKRSGFLHIKSIETARYGAFDPRGFIPPKKDWEPPFPYYLEDVLFPVESEEIIHPSKDEAYPDLLEVPMETSLPREQAPLFQVINIG